MKTYRLGEAIPCEPDGGRYSVSVSLNTVLAICNYEKGDPSTLMAMVNGYPRFFATLPSRMLDMALTEAHGSDDRRVFAFPSVEAATQCADFIKGGHVIATDMAPALVVPADKRGLAKSFRQHTGMIVSARAADDMMAGIARPVNDPEGLAVKREIRVRLADLHRCSPEDVFLYPNGMAAMHASHRAVTSLKQAPTGQFGSCYIDAKEVQTKFGYGCVEIPDGRYDMLETNLATRGLGAIFSEAVSNPKCITQDIAAIYQLASAQDAFTVLDDTLVPPTNACILPHCDMVYTSLTKSFSGIGNVMGGSVILNRASPRYGCLKTYFNAQYRDLLYSRDAIVLCDNSRGFIGRMAAFNRNGRALAEFLADHSKVEAVYHPSLDKTGNYARIRSAGGGEGGLVSFDLKDGGATRRFYDSFPGAKGPSLGMEETIICPIAMLTNFEDRAALARNNVRFNIVRSSCGVEPADEITRAHEIALRAA